jgi:hypothetical protein
MTSANGPEPGWYPDRPNATALRWWDGEGWTEHFHDLVEVEPEPDTASSEPQETTLPGAISRRELRRQVGALVVGEPDTQQPGTTALLERTIVEPREGVSDGRAPLTSLDHARLAGGYAPVGTETITDAPRPRLSPTGVRQASAQTFSGWLLALSPIWLGAGAAAVFVLLAQADQTLLLVGVVAMAIVLTFGLVKVDTMRLRDNGYEPPTAWLFLLPLVYFIVRTGRVGRRGIGMLLAYLAPQVLALGLIAWGASYLAAHPELDPFGLDVPSQVLSEPALTAQERADLLTDEGTETQLRADLTAVWDVGTVDCEPFPAEPADATTTCVVELDGALYDAGLQKSPNQPATAFVLLGMIPVED